MAVDHLDEGLALAHGRVERTGLCDERRRGRCELRHLDRPRTQGLVEPVAQMACDEHVDDGAEHDDGKHRRDRRGENRPQAQAHRPITNPIPRTVSISAGSPSLRRRFVTARSTVFARLAALPDLPDRLLPRHDATRVAQEQLEQIRLARRENHFAPTSLHRARRGIERQVAEREQLFRRVAAKQRAHTGEELLGRERLDEVVVGAGVEPGHAVGHCVARGQEQHRRREALRAEPPADGQPVEARHGHVEHDQVGGRALDGGERLAAVSRGLDHVAVGGERPVEHPADRSVVVDHEDRGLGHAARVIRSRV